MATNKKPPKHKPQMNPLFKAQLEAKMREENVKARKAGAEYGILAMKVATIMYLNSKDFTVDGYVDIADKVKDAILNLKTIDELVNDLNNLFGTNITHDDLVKLDPSLGQYM